MSHMSTRGEGGGGQCRPSSRDRSSTSSAAQIPFVLRSPPGILEACDDEGDGDVGNDDDGAWDGELKSNILFRFVCVCVLLLSRGHHDAGLLLILMSLIPRFIRPAKTLKNSGSPPRRSLGDGDGWCWWGGGAEGRSDRPAARYMRWN